MVLQHHENKKNYVQLTDEESQEIDWIARLARHKYIIARSFKTFQIVESRHQSSHYPEISGETLYEGRRPELRPKALPYPQTDFCSWAMSNQLSDSFTVSMRNELPNFSACLIGTV